MSEGNYPTEVDMGDDVPDEKTGITLYRILRAWYRRLIVKAPWELERSVSKYHERFLTEQRCMGLAILLLSG